MIITLTTDFGLADAFVGTMKGVILGIAPEARIVDLSHDVRSYDVLDAAVLIDSAYRYFPKGTVHVIVVDPGVGSARRPIAALANGHSFVAPDNGVLSAVLNGGEAHLISNNDLFLKPVSRTFHGRDIFAPTAAHLAKGAPIEAVGPRIDDALRIEFPRPRREGRRIAASVLRVDKFGNVMTNLRREDLTGSFNIHVNGARITRICATFSEASPQELFAVEGSAGYIELALNQASAADRFNIRAGAEIEVESDSSNQ